MDFSFIDSRTMKFGKVVNAFSRSPSVWYICERTLIIYFKVLLTVFSTQQPLQQRDVIKGETHSL